MWPMSSRAKNEALQAQAKELRAALKPDQKYLRGLFSGGTLCYEAQVIWRDVLNRTGALECAAEA